MLASLVAIVGLLLDQSSPAPTSPDFATKLHTQVGEWKKPAKPVLYGRKSLYDYIDGGAELYLAFDFQGATTFEYSADGDDEIKVDIFDMGSPRGAFGVFAHGRESVDAEVGQGSDYGGGLLTFWKHRWFVSVLGYPETEAKRKAVYQLGRAIATLIPEEGAPPAIIDSLPKSGLVAASVRTFHHHTLQNDYVTVSPDNPLGIDQRTEAVLARYSRKDERHVLLLVDYPSETEATKSQRNFTTTILHGRSVARVSGNHGASKHWIGIKRSGKRVAVVLDAQSIQIVTQTLAEVP